MSDDPFKPLEKARAAPLPPRPSPLPLPIDVDDPMIGESAPPEVVLDGVSPEAALPPPVATSLTEQQMVALRQAFEAVLIRSGSIPPPPRPSMAVKAAEKSWDLGAFLVKAAGVSVIFLPVLGKIWPEYLDIILALVTAMRTAGAP